MNSDLLRWLLDVDVIPKTSETLRLAWERPWPAWAWALLVIGAGLFALWSYSGLVGRRVGRGILATARCFMILLALVLLSGPMLELPQETVEQDWVLMLADRSASMTIADAETSPDPESRGGLAVDRVSRDEQLRRALEINAATFAQLAQDRHTVWMGFHIGAFNLTPSSAPDSVEDSTGNEPASPDLGDPAGSRTNINGALEQALQRAAARPVSGMVLFSDGRTDAPPSRALVRRLQAQAIPVFVVPLGSPDPIGDLAIRRVDAPRRAFIRDKVPVVVELDRFGQAVQQSGATVSLVDEATGMELDRIELEPGSPQDQITLTAVPSLAGEATWKVLVEPSGAGARADLIPDNNIRPFMIELVDRPLRVLFVEGYPRWEYRYVKNLMVREKSIESSVMLISADRDFAQEGNVPITRLPRTAEEFAAFDVIVLGDVPASFFSPQQLDLIREQVAQRGAGLLWIAGERYTPSSYVGTALADLLPMRGSLNLPPIGEPITLVATAVAERLGVLRLAGGTTLWSMGAPSAADVLSTTDGPIGWPQELADPSYGWSQLYYAQRIEPGQLKPTAEILAQTAARYNGSPLPIVMNMRYGSGQIVYVATDEIWRWRYGRGELYPDQFWMQMIRMLGRESLATAGDPATIEVAPRRVEAGQPIRVEVRLLDTQLLALGRSTIRAVLETEDGQRITELELRSSQGSEDRFATTYLADRPGQYRVRIDDTTLPLAPGFHLQAPVEVFSPDDELRRPETDHQLLASLAASTGGRVLRPEELGELPQLLPKRAVRTINPLTEPIWDSPLALILALLALTFEWIGRKVLRFA